nr:groES-like zinc-binding alcohol dehydrogenase family protein [Tanacetum cinerariifolium]
VLKWEDVEKGDLKDGEIRVRNKAIGVNFIDVNYRKATRLQRHSHQDLTDWQVGDVVAYALNPMGSYAEEQILPSDRMELIFCLIDRTKLLDKQSISNTEPMEDEEIHMVRICNRLKAIDKLSISSMMLAHMILVYNRMWLIGIYLRLVLNCTRLVDKQSFSNTEPEVTVICVDNSCLLTEFRGGGTCFVRPTGDLDDIRFALKGLMLLVFSGGRLSMDSIRLQFYAKWHKEFKVAVDVVNFGMQFLPKTKKKLLQEFVEAADNRGNSHYLYAPSGSRTSVGQQTLRSPLAPGCLPMQEEKKKKEEAEKNKKAIAKMKKKLHMTKNLSSTLKSRKWIIRKNRSRERKNWPRRRKRHFGFLCGSLACLKDRGHMVIFGQASGAPDPVPISALAVKSLYLTRPSLFQYTAKREELLETAEDVFANIANGVLRVRVNHKYPLSQAAQAHLDLESRKTMGSIVLIPDGVES